MKIKALLSNFISCCVCQAAAVIREESSEELSQCVNTETVSMVTVLWERVGGEGGGGVYFINIGRA